MLTFVAIAFRMFSPISPWVDTKYTSDVQPTSKPNLFIIAVLLLNCAVSKQFKCQNEFKCQTVRVRLHEHEFENYCS